jgi:type II secretion system protein C
MNEKRVTRLFWAIRALLIGVLFYVVVAVVVTPLHLGRSFKPHPATGNEYVGDTPQAGPTTHAPADISGILENNLFGGADPDANAQPNADDSSTIGSMISAEEQLGLRLIGVVAGGPVASRAIIQNTATKAANPYKIGDTLASAIIESIQSDTVILRHEGQRKALRLQAGATVADSRRTAGDKAPPPPSTVNRSSVRPTASEHPTSLGHMEDVFRQATIEPYVKNGETEGLKITGLQTTPLAGLFGLRNGDIIQAVNGQRLTNKQKAFQVLQKARTQPKIRMQLLRDGKTKDLSFDRE